MADLAADEVVEVKDHRVRPMNHQESLYTADANGPMRSDVAPLEISQPPGVGFRLDGPEMTWQKRLPHQHAPARGAGHPWGRIPRRW